MLHSVIRSLIITALPLAFPSLLFAADIQSEVSYIFNTFLFLVSGFLVMFMAAGFAMLEAGLVRGTSVVTILTKNIALYAIAGIMFYLIGYNLMYTGVDTHNGLFGNALPWSASHDGLETGYSPYSDWFFQMVFVATAASIVSGTLAERIRLWPFLIFVAVLTGVIYPIVGSWKWGLGWLDAKGFLDFAGSTIVHSTGGWAALTGAIFLGARYNRYLPDGRATIMPGSNLPLATLGTFILWLGWLGFNGGSQLALGSVANAHAVATIFVNTNMAAAAGVVTAVILTQILYKKVDLTMVLNGALGGLVSITAEPLTPTIPLAMAVGVVGAVIVVFAVPLLDKLKIDDVVGAIPVHLFCGIWGTLAVAFTNPEASFIVQLTGVGAIAAFVIVSSSLFWLILKLTGQLRLTDDEQRRGVDHTEMGMEAYPDFVTRGR